MYHQQNFEQVEQRFRHLPNDQLRQILAALLCGVFGMWLSGYVGRGMGTQPNQFLIAMFLAFVLNGPYMDKQLRKDEILI